MYAKMKRRNNLKHLLLLAPVLLAACSSPDRQVNYPYSQWTVGLSGHHLSWQYPTDLELNSSFIKYPEAADWNDWYNELTAYRDRVKEQIGIVPPVIRTRFGESAKARIHFDKIGYDQQLAPGETIGLEGEVIHGSGRFRVYSSYDLKTKDEELSYVVRKSLWGPDTLTCSCKGESTTFALETKVPGFDPDSFSITPILWVESLDPENQEETALSGIRLSVPHTPERKNYLRKVEAMIRAQAEDNALQIPETFDWMHDNFVMGFAFIWDTDFWDPVAGEYTVDAFCEKMDREFGGMQSVVLWHSYPNIGIDDKNQFDMFGAMPGGLEGLREVTEAFHEHGVKVFITYNPWDLDTRRPPQSDNEELARVLDAIGADGIYLDTWKSSCGVISIFSVDRFIREAVAAQGREVAFSTEIHPEFKDLVGYNALTCSWGQEIEPYHYTDLSLVKWIMPQHKQHYIRRMNTDRRQELTHAWINGQGIQVWEDIFGTMNPWHANDRQVLRKMNTIWQSFGRMYVSENWLPLLPLEGGKTLMSVWTVGSRKIINLVNLAENEKATVTLNEEQGEDLRYYDLWSGEELIPEGNPGTITFSVTDFGCILISDDKPEGIDALLEAQQLEDLKNLPPPGNDPHVIERSIKHPFQHTYKQAGEQGGSKADLLTAGAGAPGLTIDGLLTVKAGRRTLETRHIWREGHCYPNPDAKDNHDLDISREGGTQWINHSVAIEFDRYAIMPQAVTNRQFATFLDASGYTPRFPENFLKHWDAGSCPDTLLDEPVVYVGLEDARAYAEWAGMRLPSEWEWQLAREEHGEDFVINNVFEWNESERYDGHNRFVTLRGGCSNWTMPSSWWYLPSAPRGKTVGGPQRYDSHVKYFLMYPGLDRAKTIGFRCVKLTGD